MNWFKYRLPDSTSVFCGASDTLEEGIGDGFLIAPFLNPTKRLITIPAVYPPLDSFLHPAASNLPESTTKEEYFTEIDAIKKSLADKRGKTVAARAIRLRKSTNVNETFYALCKSYPDAFVFAFYTSETGTWIGASPELLVDKEGQTITTMALAGTRPVSTEDDTSPWDTKNIDEQKLVEEFIYDCLSEVTTDVRQGDVYTKRAGRIEHLCTPLSATLPTGDKQELEDLLSRLSPTPALCGSDREHSLALIKEYEHFDREMYGGFCGPCYRNGDVSLYVTLRCAKCSSDATAVFAGGGITALSDPETEWNETELKSKTIISKLK